MIKLGTLLLDGEIPRIAVSFRDGVSDQVIAEARYKGLDIAELRIDLFTSRDPEHVLREAGRFSQFPTIATIRSRAEGGSWGGTEEERLRLFQKILPAVDAADIELSSGEILDGVIQEARKHNKVSIVSYHNFEGTPPLEALNALVRKAKDRGADIVKVATLSREQKDIKTLGDMTLHNAGENIVSIAMGEHGAMSRIIFPGLGSLFSFASMGSPTAPGQMSFDETLELLRKFYPELKK